MKIATYPCLDTDRFIAFDIEFTPDLALYERYRRLANRPETLGS